MTNGFDLQDLRTDDILSSEGVWIDLGGGARLKIARLGNPAFKAIFNARLKPYQDSGIDPKEEIQEEMMNESLAHAVLLGWEGITDNGKVVKYSRKEAIRVLTELPQLRAIVIKNAQNFDLFKQQKDKVIEGN